MKHLKTDVAVIGAGITGCAIARQLSRYVLNILVIEKEPDAGCGTTRANSGLVHPGYAGDEGTLRLTMCHNGSLLFRKIAPELDIPMIYSGSLLHAEKRQDIAYLEELKKKGTKYGVKGLRVLRGYEEIKKIEPSISKNVVASLYCAEHIITSPYEAALALFENAAENSAKFLFGQKVFSIKYEKSSKAFFIETEDYKGVKSILIEASYVINAAGVFADEIAAMAGDDSFKIQSIKGQYFLLDSNTGPHVKLPNLRLPDPDNIRSKGMVVTPTSGGNLLVGSNYELTDKNDSSTTYDELEEIRKKLSRLIENIPFEKIITAFAGSRAYADTGDFILGPIPHNERFINAAGIQSPGLTCAFLIAEMMADYLKDAGLPLKNNSGFKPQREAIKKINKENLLENNSLYRTDNKYGEIICRCEKVSEAEIVEAIKRGAATIDGIKFRTRAGMGRCQGGYCMLRVLKILSRELGVPVEEITKSGGNSFVALKKMN